MDKLSHGWCLILLLSLSLCLSCAKPAEEKQAVITEPREEDVSSRALYVNGFSNILGDRDAEKKLLEFAASHEFDVLLLYELHLVLDKNNAADLAHNSKLASFISTAKSEYGVSHVAAIGDHGDFFRDVVDPYNNSRSKAQEKFDIYNLEFEFWIDSQVKEVYSESYLVPNGLASNVDGAFEFFVANLKEMRALAQANSHTIVTEAYIGWTDKLTGKTEDEVAELIAQNLDQLRVHAYRSKPDYAYTASRLAALAKAKPGMEVSVIFSGEEEFMQNWLESNSMEAAENEFSDQLQEAATDEVKEGIGLLGFTYYNYSHNIDVPIR